MEMSISALTLSIVICTYNRAKYLKLALESVCPQIKDRNNVEILVIDNNCTDNTKEICRNFSQHFPPVRYIHEEKQGLSHARNRGWKEAWGDYVAYLDDDAKANPEWVSEALKIIHAYRPGTFGGPYYPFYDSPKPDWFLDAYGSKVHYQESGFIKERPNLSGGNLFIKRELIKHCGGFSSDVGMTGNKIAYGEETLLLWRIYHKFPNEKHFYEKKLYILHLVRKEKFSLHWRFKQQFASGMYIARVKLTMEKESISWKNIIGRGIISLLSLISRFTWRFFVRDKKRHPTIRNYIYEYASEPLIYLGRVYEWIIIKRKKFAQRNQFHIRKGNGAS